MHLLLAAALLWHGAALVLRVMRNHRGQVALRRPTWILTGLLVAQCGLGAGTWVMKYGWPDWIADTAWTAGYTISASSFGQSMVVTAHMATGSLILAMAVLITLRAFRLVEGEPRSARASTFLAGVAA
jgi:cytochrome c oxidase assembly protein subunit 15